MSLNKLEKYINTVNRDEQNVGLFNAILDPEKNYFIANV